MQAKRFGTFEGVFTPTLLSILGVIMYLRLGWVVGQVGLGGALIIIVLANLITILTALSMSSIVTNIRIGAGGAYSMITKSLGVEAGGAIGIPLYLSQAISVGFYITGFTELWMVLFPTHIPLLISLTVWLILLVISYCSAKMAFQLQYGVLAIVGLSIISIFLGQDKVAPAPLIWQGVNDKSFWHVFAIFFPAVTGILAGASMSGELKDPKESIPKGTMAGIIVSFIVYCSLAVWFAYNVPQSDLIQNTSIVIDSGRWRLPVIAGIMGAILSSALNMLVSSPRTLLALGKHSILPFSSALSHINKRGEPTTAILFTSLLVLITVIFANLNQVATLLTMIFLITYGMINLSVFIEQSIGIASFRPTFRLPKTLTLAGSIGCLIVMFIINTKFTLIAIFIIIITYLLLLKREVQIYSPDVRSGLLLFMAEQLAREAAKLPYHPKIWKPNLIIPVRDVEEAAGILPFVKDIIFPSGRVILFNVVEINKGGDKNFKDEMGIVLRNNLNSKLHSLIEPLREDGMLIRASVVESSDLLTGSATMMQSSKHLYFPSNTLFCQITDEKHDAEMDALINKAESEGLGAIVLYKHPEMGFSQEKIINLWIRKKSPNIDLSILMALQLEKNWEGQVRLIQVVGSEAEKEDAKEYLSRLISLMRLPRETEIEVLTGAFKEKLLEAPAADINIFGMQENPDIPMIRSTVQSIKTSVLFLRDSEHESATA